MMIRLFTSAALAAVLVTSPAIAQQAPSRDDHDHHDDQPGDVVITAPIARSLEEQLGGTSVVRGEELVRELRPTIGDTLQRQPGVSATSFGPNASRPVLRGLQGDRVRVLSDGIGSFDVSNTSVDHAVAINPLTADRIEVLRGPSALLFGSSAIGGVVNVIDSRIPRRVPNSVHVDALGTYGSAADERSGSAAVDVPVGSDIVFHVDGSYSKTDDLETGGYILSRALRREAAASDDAEVQALADLKGRLDNTASERWEVAGGAAIVNAGGSLGFSVSHLENTYGVPNRLELVHEDDGEEHEHGDVRLDMRQTRFDLRGEVVTGGFIDRLRLRAGIADYRHDELEPTGEIGTSFFSQGLEARLEAVQSTRGNWRGASGVQMVIRNFEARGEEKFVPRSETQAYGVFTVQSFDFGAARAEVGGRYERSIIAAQADADLGNPFIRRTFDTFSGSIGGSVAVIEGLRLGLNAVHSERAPSAEELFSNGPHAGTQSFEVGNPDFGRESSNGIEATLKGGGDGWNVGLSGYYNWFDGFIYQGLTGDEEDGLPVFQYAQADARLYGFEAEASARLATLGGYNVVVDGVADYTRATIDEAGPAPRIPPLRLLGGVEAQGDVADARVEVERVFEQDRIAAFETPTDGYTMVNASLALRPFGRGKGVSLTLAANNIFDVEARRHASVLKDFAPLAGRDIRVSARLSF